MEDLEHKIRIKRFYTRRSFKIIPSYFLVIMISLFLSVIVHPKFLRSPLTVISHFLFFQNYLPRIPILGHTWAIAIEGHFYLIYPLLLHAICLMIKNPRSRHTLLLFLLLILIILGNILRYYFFQLPIASSYPAIWQMTQFRFDALIFGCLIKLLEPHFKNTRQRQESLYAFLFFICAVLMFIYIALNFNYFTWYHYTLAYLASGLLIISGLQESPILKRITENKWIMWIGKNSYGIYLWHLIALYPFKKLIPHLCLPVLIAGYIATSILIGALSTATIEKYFLNLRKHIAP